MADVIKPGDGKLGFTPMEDGDYTLEFQEGIKFVEKDGVETKRLMFPLKDKDGDGRIAVFCDLEKKGGLLSLGKLLLFSGLHQVIERDEKLPHLAESGWPEKVLKSDKLVKLIQVKMPGRVIGGKVETKGNYTNITEVYKAGKQPEPEAETSTESGSSNGDDWS